MVSAAAVLEFIRDWAKSLFPHDKVIRYVLLGFVALLLLAFASRCRASDAMAEVGAQYLRGPAAAMLVTVVSPGPKDASIETGLLLIGSSNRDDAYGGPGVMGIQALVVDGFGRFDLGLGVAYMNRVHQNLGSEMNFSLLARYRITDRWSVSVRHWSNASTTKNNVGLDVLTVGFKF